MVQSYRSGLMRTTEDGSRTMERRRPGSLELSFRLEMNEELATFTELSCWLRSANSQEPLHRLMRC